MAVNGLVCDSEVRAPSGRHSIGLRGKPPTAGSVLLHKTRSDSKQRCTRTEEVFL